MPMFIVGVCGASGSGKTAFSSELSAMLENSGISTYTLSQDCYYVDQANVEFDERCKTNYDTPTAFDMDALVSDIEKLKCGTSIRKHIYDYTQHRRMLTTDFILPTDVLIVEGICTFADLRLLDIYDFKIFVDVDADVCLTRRLTRDIVERGRSVQDVIEQYLETVKPMRDEYCDKYKRLADMCVLHGGKNMRVVSAIYAYIMLMHKE